MAIQLVESSSAIDMIGPYLAARATCPACKHENVLLHIEGPTSPVKPVSVCRHITAHIVEDGVSNFEFSY
jgi:hypothetical protein